MLDTDTLNKVVTHYLQYRSPYNGDRVYCGRIAGVVTDNPDEVTCQDCRERMPYSEGGTTRPDNSFGDCDYCTKPVEFRTERNSSEGWFSFTHLEPVIAGSGSDYLAIWCADCGPKHRVNW